MLRLKPCQECLFNFYQEPLSSFHSTGLLQEQIKTLTTCTLTRFDFKGTFLLIGFGFGCPGICRMTDLTMFVGGWPAIEFPAPLSFLSCDNKNGYFLILYT